MVVAIMILGFWTAREMVAGVPATLWFGLALAWIALAGAIRGWACRIALGAAVAFGSAGWWTLRIDERSASSLAWSAAFDGPVTVFGVIADEPRPVPPPRGALGMFAAGPPGTIVELDVLGAAGEADTMRPASGHVRVRVDDDIAARPEWVRAGGIVRVSGLLSGVRGVRNPGEPDRRAWAAQEDVIGDLETPEWSNIAAAEADGVGARVRSVWSGWTSALHARSIHALGLDEPPEIGGRPEARALLGALLLGERDADLGEVQGAFQRLGLLHLVAISGFNLAVMAGVAIFLLRLSGDRGWIEPVIVAGLVIGYMLVLPAQTPILRAGVMVVALLLTEALGRRYDRVTVLGWIAVIMLLYRPLDAWSLSFQLSFGIVGVLLAFGDEVNGRIFGVPLRGLVKPSVAHGRPGLFAWLPALGHWCIHAFKAQTSASILAWAVATPVIIYHTGLLSPLAALTTLIVLPLTVIVLWVGYIALLVGMFIPSAGAASGWVLERMAALLVDTVMALDTLPGMSVRLPAISLLWTFFAVAVVFYWLRRGHTRDRRAWSLTAIILAWGVAEVTLGPRWAARHPLRLDALAVGEGTCVLVRSRGEAMLWDCGSRSTGIGERLVPDALRALGASRVPTVVVAGFGLEHFAGVIDIVEPMGVRRVIVTEPFLRAARADGAGPEARLIDELRRRDVRIETLAMSDSPVFGAAHIKQISPQSDAIFSRTDDASMVARIEVATDGALRRVMFTSDVGDRVLAAISDADARAEVVFPPRNGAFSPAAAEFLGRSSPWLVVQSGGGSEADPRWTHVEQGRVWMSTDVVGAVGVIIDDRGELLARPLIPASR